MRVALGTQTLMKAQSGLASGWIGTHCTRLQRIARRRQVTDRSPESKLLSGQRGARALS
jgi:hypothetical protein